MRPGIADITAPGLGLPVVRQIVESYGGEIYVDSREGEGTRFRVWFPATSSVRPSEPIPVVARNEDWGQAANEPCTDALPQRASSC